MERAAGDRTGVPESATLTIICVLFHSGECQVGAEAVGPAIDLMQLAADRKFRTVLAGPPWRFINRTGKVAPEHRRLSR